MYGKIALVFGKYLLLCIDPFEDTSAGLWRGVSLNSVRDRPLAGWFPPSHWTNWPLVDVDQLDDTLQARYYEAMLKCQNGDYAVQ